MSNEEIEFRTLKLLEQNSHLSQRELSTELGVSLGKAHYVVKALIDMGWVKLGNFSHSDKKMGYLYILTPSGIREKAAITTRFLNRKLTEYESQLSNKLCTDGETPGGNPTELPACGEL